MCLQSHLVYDNLSLFFVVVVLSPLRLSIKATTATDRMSVKVPAEGQAQLALEMYLLKLSTLNNNQQAKIRESSTVSILEINYRKLNRKKKKEEDCSQNIERSGRGTKDKYYY